MGGTSESAICCAGFAGVHPYERLVLRRSDKPTCTAVLSVGRPGGVAVFDTHQVDSKGALISTFSRPMMTTCISMTVRPIRR